ncbi:adenylate cyclase [Mesorhizobium sp. L-8-10]|uniref:adenylate/guanylate cyclase domain-containing protein n=1 Tax=Mesorhizobium sp. L-8-10 TaxID=2744523 RepID=UPI00192552C7|nr:adenylate/guanylate cyclase domain-containing protein [Mesorhizobium sp. L-8-10]BCH35358.1 adenylate cyclase [Mesorhizobium sp. L-8-10]
MNEIVAVPGPAMMSHGDIDHAAIDALIAWMIDGAPPSRGETARPGSRIDDICRRLVAAGVPIGRFALFVNLLHPNIEGRRIAWTAEDGVTITDGPIGVSSTVEYTRNPLPKVISEQVSIRRRLNDPDALSEFMILSELRDEGFTDYMAMPLVFTDGEIHAATFSTKAPQGFSLEAIAAIELIRRPLARLAETYVLRINAASILSAYVGRNSGDQILGGSIHRGDGEEIEAAILFTDLIGFTELSNTMSGPEIVTMLNDAFDIVVPPVEKHGGEVLKFLGDGFFAIFPYNGKTTRADAVKAASETILEGETLLAASPHAGKIAFRSALHAGSFHYGNIGGANRLDFTAIGGPINYAARLLDAAAVLDLRHVVSEEIATNLCVDAKLAATVEFKGFEGPQKLFTYCGREEHHNL